MGIRTDDGAADDTDDVEGIEAVDLERYTEIRLENGEVVIYDVDNESAWVQSPSAVPLETMA